MGREIRRVPPNWEHPKTQRPNHLRGRMEECYQPMRDQDAESAWKSWQEEFSKWLGGEFDRVRRKNPDYGYDAAQPYRAFCSWYGDPPDPEYYRPAWKEEATWFQVYETVSEGTPVTPPFATKEELVDYLVANGDFWDQSRRAEGRSTMECGPWKRENAEKFVNAGFAPSMMVTTTAAGTVIKEPRDGIC